MFLFMCLGTILAFRKYFVPVYLFIFIKYTYTICSWAFLGGFLLYNNKTYNKTYVTLRRTGGKFQADLQL